ALRLDAVELDVARHPDALRGDADALVVVGVFLRLRGEEIDLREYPPGEPAEAPQARRRARAHAAVDHQHRHAPLVRRGEKVRPQLAPCQHDQRRLQAPEHAADGPGEVERIPEYWQVGEAFARLVEAGAGRGRDRALPVGMALAERRDDDTQELDLAEA